MFKVKRLLVFVCLFLVICLSTYQPINLSTDSYAQQIGIGVEFSPGAPASKKEEKTKESVRDSFIIQLAERFSLEEKELNRLYLRGYGYGELISLILISKKADKPLEEIVKKRDREGKIKKIAEDYQLDYRSIYNEVKQIKEEIGNYLRSQPSLDLERKLPEGTTAPLSPGTIESAH